MAPSFFAEMGISVYILTGVLYGVEGVREPEALADGRLVGSDGDEVCLDVVWFGLPDVMVSWWLDILNLKYTYYI